MLRICSVCTLTPNILNANINMNNDMIKNKRCIGIHFVIWLKKIAINASMTDATIIPNINDHV